MKKQNSSKNKVMQGSTVTFRVDFEPQRLGLEELSLPRSMVANDSLVRFHAIPSAIALEYLHEPTQTWQRLTVQRTLPAKAIANGHLRLRFLDQSFSQPILLGYYLLDPAYQQLGEGTLTLEPESKAAMSAVASLPLARAQVKTMTLKSLNINRAAGLKIKFTSLSGPISIECYDAKTKQWRTLRTPKILMANELAAGRVRWIVDAEAPLGAEGMLEYAVLRSNKIIANERLMLNVVANQLTSIQGQILGDLQATLVEDTNVSTYYTEGPGGKQKSDLLVATGQVTLQGQDAMTYGFIPCEHVGSFGKFSMNAQGAWRYTADNDSLALQALAAGEIAMEQFTIQAVTGAQQDITITLHGTNDAPRLLRNHDLAMVHPESLTNDGDYVHSLIESIDIDHGAVAGIAITHIDTKHGKWEYSLDDGKNWRVMERVVESHALLLGETAKVRFVPNQNSKMGSQITYRVWDQTIGHEGDYADTRNPKPTSAFSSQYGTSYAHLRDVAPMLDHFPMQIKLRPGEALRFAAYPFKLIYTEETNLSGGRFCLKSNIIGTMPQPELFFLQAGHPSLRVQVTQGNEHDYIADIFYLEALVAKAHVVNRLNGLKPLEAGIDIEFIGAHATLPAVTAAIQCVGFIKPLGQSEQSLQCLLADRFGHRTLYNLTVSTQFQPATRNQQVLHQESQERLLTLQDFPYRDLAQRPLQRISVIEQHGNSGELLKWEATTQEWLPLIAPFQLEVADLQHGHIKFVPIAVTPSVPFALTFALYNGQTWSNPAVLQIEQAPNMAAMPVTSRLVGKVLTEQLEASTTQGVITEGQTAKVTMPMFAAKQRLTGTYGYLEVEPDGTWTYHLASHLPAVKKLGAGTMVNDQFILTTLQNKRIPITVQVIGSNEAPHLIETREFTPIDSHATTNEGNFVSEIFLSEDLNENAEEGLAVTDVDNTHGTWQYSFDMGNTWYNFVNISETHALLLGLDAKIRFVPDSDHPADSHIEYRAWDHTSGVEGDYIDASHPNPHGALSDNKGSSVIHLNDLAPQLMNLLLDRVLEVGKPIRLAYPATRLETALDNLTGLNIKVYTLAVPQQIVREQLLLVADEHVAITPSVATHNQQEGVISYRGSPVAQFEVNQPIEGQAQGCKLILNFTAANVSRDIVRAVFGCIAYVNHESHQHRELYVELREPSGEMTEYCIRTLSNQRPVAKSLTIPVSLSQARILAANDFNFFDADKDTLKRIELEPVQLGLGKLYRYKMDAGIWQPIDHTALISIDEIEQGYLKFIANNLAAEQAQTVLNYKVYDGLSWSDGASISFITQASDQDFVSTLPLIALHVTGLDTGLNETLVIDGKTMPIEPGQQVTTDHGYTVVVENVEAATQCKVSGNINPAQIRSLLSEPNVAITGTWTTDITLPNLANTVTVEGKPLQVIPFESTITFDNPLRKFGSDSKIQILQTGALYSQATHDQALCINTAFSTFNDSALRGMEESSIPVATQGNILRLIGDDAELDLGLLNTNTIRNIQMIDLGAEDAHARQLSLNVTEAIQLSQDSTQHHLIVEGGKYDKIKFKSNDGGSWKLLKDEEEIDSNHYHVYEGNVKGQVVNVYVNALMAA